MVLSALRRCHLSVRTRVIPYEGPVFGRLRTRTYNSAGQLVQNTTFENQNTAAFLPLQGVQYTESESHPLWRTRVRGRFDMDMGGPFTSRKRYSVMSNGEEASVEGIVVDGQTHVQTEAVYNGPYLPCSPTFLQWPSFNSSSDSSLKGFGTTAIARCSPSNPSANLTESVGEIVGDGLPSIIGGKLLSWRAMSSQERRRSFGDEFLNYQFGWLPFLSDLTDISRSIVHADRILDQYDRDSGKLVRRGYRFPTIVSESNMVYLDKRSPWTNPSSDTLQVNSLINKGQVIRSEYSAIDRWFSGAFTYYVPPSNGLRNDMARCAIQARKLLGLSLTPDSIWNLAPWSWAVDWFSNVGDVLSNWTAWAIDNQVLWYGYMMEHSLHAYRYTFTGQTGYRSGLQPPDVYLISETKLRRKATPYGFNLSWDNFTTRQKAIVAALGISRS